MRFFNRQHEHGEYLKETYDFIADEIAYATRMIAYFHGSGQREEKFVRSAQRYLGSLDAAYHAARKAALKGGRSETDGRLHRVFLNAFPDLIRDLTTALFQRNEVQPPRILRAPHAPAPFAPSEVTLEYPVTIRAAEALSEDYHARLAHFYGEAYSTPPLVNLSGSTAATLQLREPLAQVVADRELLGETPTMQERNERMTRHLLNLSCIALPRWSSQHVRTYAFAAHEHMHRALARVWTLTRGLLSEYSELDDKTADLHADWRSSNPELKKRAIDAVQGYTAPFRQDKDFAIGSLFGLTYALFQRVWDFFRRSKLRYVHDPAAKPEWIKELRYAAWEHTIELLADAGALVIAGPAFAFAFRTVFTPNTSRDLSDLRERVSRDAPHHPPTLLRAHLHTLWLKELGFYSVSETLDDANKKEWDLAQADPHAGLLTAYASFVSDDVGEMFKRAIDIVGGDGNPDSYDLRKRSATTSLAVAEPEVEMRLLARWTAVAHQIETERKYLPEDIRNAALPGESARAITPADMINAIWLKRIDEGTEHPKNRLAWRVALRNSARQEAI